MTHETSFISIHFTANYTRKHAPYLSNLPIIFSLITIRLTDKFRRIFSIKDWGELGRALLVIIASWANFTGVFVSWLFWQLDILLILFIIVVLSFFPGILFKAIGKSIFCTCFSMVAGALTASYISVSPLIAQGKDFIIVQYYFWQVLQKVVPTFLIALGLALLSTLSAGILRDLFD